jgi:hypothetical protein
MKEFGQLFNMGLGQLGGSTNLAAFASMRDAKNKPIPVAIKSERSPTLSGSSERGSEGHLLAILKQRGVGLDASFTDIAKQQLNALNQIATNTSNQGVGVV